MLIQSSSLECERYIPSLNYTCADLNENGSHQEHVHFSCWESPVTFTYRKIVYVLAGISLFFKQGVLVFIFIATQEVTTHLVDSNITHLLAHSSVNPNIHLDSMLKASPSQNQGADQAKLLSGSSERVHFPAHTGEWQSPVLCSCRSEVPLSLLADQALISANKTLL